MRINPIAFMMLHSHKILPGVVAVVLVIVAGYFFIFSSEKNGEDKETAIQEAIPFSFEESAVSTSVVLGVEYQKFTHPDLAFSIEYLKGFSVEAYKEASGGETIIFQDEGDTDDTLLQDRSGFQIFITPFENEEGVLTRERILEDLPTAVIEDPQEIIIGDNIQALLFWSEDPFIGRTREVWFSYGENLYEITTYAHLGLWLAQILSTWDFADL